MTRYGFLAFPAAVALTLLLAVPSPRAQADDGPLRLSLGYDGRLLFKVLDIQVDASADAGGFETRARLISTGILAVFKHVNEITSSQGRIVNGAPAPGRFEYQHLSGKSHRKVRVIWNPGDVSMTATPAFGSLGDPPASREQKLAAADPLTFVMRLTLNATRADLCRHSYLFFDGKQLYALELSNPREAQASETETRLGLTNHFRCDVHFRQVAGFSRKPPDKRDQGLEHPIDLDFARIGQDGPFVISRLRAPTPLGVATIELKRLTVSGKDPTS